MLHRITWNDRGKAFHQATSMVVPLLSFPLFFHLFPLPSKVYWLVQATEYSDSMSLGEYMVKEWSSKSILTQMILWQKTYLFSMVFTYLGKDISGKESCLTMQETQETWVWFLDQEDPLEEEMATCSILPGKPHGQRSLVGYILWGCKWVRQDWTHTHTRAIFLYV